MTATYESYDDETGENETVEVDADAYQEALDVLAPYQGDQNAIAAFEAAAIEEGLDPESEDFTDEAADAGIIATYVDEDGETQEVDADTYAEEVEGSEPDPTEYGMWVPGIPVLVEQGLDSIGCADWLKALILDGIVAGVVRCSASFPRCWYCSCCLPSLSLAVTWLVSRSSLTACSAALAFPASRLCRSSSVLVAACLASCLLEPLKTRTIAA